MGAQAALLLVAALAAAPAGVRQEQACTQRVDPADYQRFFVWAGTRPVAVPASVEEVYILAGEVRRGGAPRLILLNAGPHVADAGVWLVVRTDRLDWTDDTLAAIMVQLRRWQAAGNRLNGLQIDFDASTARLDRYAGFLARVRAALPSEWRLSATGLLDWGAHGDPAVLARLSGTVDELVMQTYRARRTEPGYAAYFDGLVRLPVRHKVAIVAGGQWCEPPALARDPGFAGYVVFLPPIGANHRE